MLSLFDEEIDTKTNTKMINNLNRDESSDSSKRYVPSKEEITQNLFDMTLDDFVNQRSKRFLSRLQIDDSFLWEDVSSHFGNPAFLETRRRLSRLKVANDTAERAVKLMQNFNGLITAKEEQKQFLLRCVQEHRNLYPDCKKTTLKRILDQTKISDQGSRIKGHPNVSTSTEVQTRKPFEDLGNKQKKRRSGGLSDYSEEELSFALVANLKKNKRMELAEVIEHLMKNPHQAPSVKAYLTPRKTIIQADQALALTTSFDRRFSPNLSKWQYLVLRGFMSDAESSAKLPSYHKLLETKKNCYPDPSDIEISEQGAKVKLQALLNLTCKRILQVVGAIDVSEGELKMTSKWGFDGSSSQSTYKQRSEILDLDDSSVFMTSLVPLKLESANRVIWENPKPSSDDLLQTY
ncbi:hypothetical protein ACJJTC_016527 [Scirpophaga incertulas]